MRIVITDSSSEKHLKIEKEFKIRIMNSMDYQIVMIKTYNILLLLAEILLLMLKVLYYICEDVYRFIVPTKKKSVAGEIVLVFSRHMPNNMFLRVVLERVGVSRNMCWGMRHEQTLKFRITGVGHGIGKELAIGYASLGATVVCWDINEETNNETMNDIKRMGRDSVYAYRCNVADREEVFRVAEKVKKEIGDVTILVNNAGIGFSKSFLNHSLDEIERIIDINVTAHYWTLKAFLPSMIEKNHGHIVALSSLAGLISAPYGTIYCPSKFAVKTIMEAMSEELRAFSNGKSSIKFTTIYPSLVLTGIVKKPKIRFPMIAKGHLPQEAASLIIDAQRQNYENRSIPSYYLSLVKIGRLLPDKALKCILDFIDSGVYPED